MGAWELLLLLALSIILIAARRLVRLGQPGSEGDHPFLVWTAQGFGLGRVPWAAGTFGSAAGLLGLILLLQSGCLVIFIGALLVAILFSVWACGVAERVLGRKDPGSVVLDEIVAMPLCFLGWIGIITVRTGSAPAPEFFFSKATVAITVAIFALFRLFDIAKPWPVRQSQSLPGGWGIVVDDLLAAVYVNAVVLLVFFVKQFINQ